VYAGSLLVNLDGADCVEGISVFFEYVVDLGFEFGSGRQRVLDALVKRCEAHECVVGRGWKNSVDQRFRSPDVWNWRSGGEVVATRVDTVSHVEDYGI